jgi:hypothetical protein
MKFLELLGPFEIDSNGAIPLPEHPLSSVILRVKFGSNRVGRALLPKTKASAL